MSVQDVIKNSILELETYSSSFTAETMVSIVVSLICAVIFGLFINFIYTKFYRGVVYNRNFSITLVGMTVMTAMVTLAISTNIVISLGMVGALSIVRFRTAIKDPLDLLYLFWAITTGITVGASMYPLAVMASVIMFLVILIMNKKVKNGQVYIVIVQYRNQPTGDAIRIAMARVNYRIKSKTMRGDLCEIAMEVNMKGDNLSFADKIRAIDGVEDVTVIQYDGEYHD